MNALTKQNKLLPSIIQTAQRSLSSASDAPPKSDDETKPAKPKSDRYVEFEKKLRAKTPLGKLDEHTVHPFQEKEPLKPWPGGKNPHTGEIGGPAGPEPTRYGDWERKGRVTDF